MTVPPENLALRQCYLTAEGRLLLVRDITPEGWVRFEYRDDLGGTSGRWGAGILERRVFAALAVRQVSCDWTPEAEA